MKSKYVFAFLAVLFVTMTASSASSQINPLLAYGITTQPTTTTPAVVNLTLITGGRLSSGVRDSTVSNTCTNSTGVTVFSASAPFTTWTLNSFNEYYSSVNMTLSNSVDAFGKPLPILSALSCDAVASSKSGQLIASTHYVVSAP